MLKSSGRGCFHAAYRVGLISSRAQSLIGNLYEARLASEKAIYHDCVDVHELPPIFHYWSDKYIRPKLEEFGFSSPDEAFRKYLRRACSRRLGASRFVSIGAGNCDLEIGLARDLVANGFTDFEIECLDLNGAMLERGAGAARETGVAEYLTFTACDFNAWLPAHEYDGVIANQSLHHVVELEKLFARVKDCLSPGAPFIISDMIGRNGHLRWPEALEMVCEFWRKLPPSYRFNNNLKRYEEIFQNFDCSSESFEGIRSQDVLPLLLDNFHFELFIGFANVIDPFVDRTFGANFNVKGEWDRAFIDAVHACDESALASGRVKPTHMIAVVGKDTTLTTRYSGKLSPHFSVRDPHDIATVPMPHAAALYAWNSWPHPVQQEAEIACAHLREAAERIEQLLAWGNRLDIEIAERTQWAESLQKDCIERTAWAQRLDRELSDARADIAELARDSEERGKQLESQLTERTAWALRLDEELGRSGARGKDLEAEVKARTDWALDLERQLEDRTAWALSLNSELQERSMIPLWAIRRLNEFRESPWKTFARVSAGAVRLCVRILTGRRST